MKRDFNYTLTFSIAFEQQCFALLVSAYQTSISENSIQLNWNENDITAQLHSHIKLNPSRHNWQISTNVEQYLSNKKQKTKGFANKFARIDLRLVTWSAKVEYTYFFEAKNLKEKNDNGLKKRYIETGIDNIVFGKYPKNTCLVGYLLAGDLSKTISGINSLLKKVPRNTEVLKNKKINFHSDYYESSHQNFGVLKHLMFDFTKIKTTP